MKAGSLIAGKYRLMRPIGKGAMGTVWEATHEGTSRQVAIKLILEPTDELRIRLTREARAYGALRHRNIVEVLDVGQTDEGDPFLVMQLLVGETLADRLARQRRLGVPEATRIARDVARALDAAHKASIIHRDLKPANIFLHDEPDEEVTVVKVVDFGVSKNLLASDGLSTVVGGMVGSPAYMSPEQAAAGARGPVDHRADLWSLGVVLFEMLTGVRPLQGDVNTIIPQIVSAEIPLVTRFVRTIDPKLAALVARCLDRDLSRRVGSAADLAAQLQPFTSASHGSGAFSLGQSGSGLISPLAPASRSDAAVIASPRAPFAPGPEPSAAVLASPRVPFASAPDRDSSARSPRPQGGLLSGPAMPGPGDDDDNQATAKLSPDMMRAFKPAPPRAPPRMPPRAGGTVPIQSDPALPPYRAQLPSQNMPPPAPPSFNPQTPPAAPPNFKTTLPLQNDPAFGSGSSWPAPTPTTAKLDPNSTWGAEPSVANGGTMRMSPEDMMKIRSSAPGTSPMAPPPAPPAPPAPLAPLAPVFATSSLIQQSGGDLLSTSQAAALQQQKRRRMLLLVVGSVVGVVLAILAVVVMVVMSSKGGVDAEQPAPAVAATGSTPVLPVASAPPPGAPAAEVAPPRASATPSTAPSMNPAPVVSAPPASGKPPVTGLPSGPKQPLGGTPAGSTKSGTKLPGFLGVPAKTKTKTNPTGP